MFAKSRITHLWLFHFLADFAAIVAAYYSVLLFRFHSNVGAAFFNTLNQWFGVGTSGIHGDAYQLFYIVSAPRIISYLTITLCLLYALRDLYPDRRFIRKRPVVWNIIVANVVALAIFYTYFYLRRNIFHPRSFLAMFVIFNILFCAGFRGLVDRLLNFIRRSFGIDRHRVILVGMNEDADFIKWYIEETHSNGLHLVGQLGIDTTKDISAFIATLEQKTTQENADLMILADKGLSVPQTMQLLELGERTNTAVKVLSDKMNVLISHAKVPVDMIRGCPLVHFEVPMLNRKPSIGRRLVTLFLAGIALLLTLPLTLIIAMLIKLTSRGPVFFIQERIGVNRKPFRMLKFRTMYDRADELQAQVEEFNESGKGLFKIRNDRRITPIGRLLRRFSLDEVPQLINVLRGEMAIVGPRPLPRRDFENYYEEWHYTRHNGIPGLTCLWQISGRSDLGFHDMCILDVFYLTNRNWVLDLKIAIRTSWAVLFGKGAY